MSALFRMKAPGIMRELMLDFELDVDDAAAIVGNLGHESGGFRFLQEKRPLVPGSRGGYGWAQWTGARRRAYEEFCAKHRIDPASDDANYRFLCLELRTSERAAVAAVRRARGLRAKVVAFEQKFERAHPDYKHYDSRLRYAETARDAFHAAAAVSGLFAADAADAPGRAAAQADDDGAPPPEPLPPPLVEHYQERLRRLGYHPGAVDGELAGRTAGAIASLQFDRGIAVTGRLDPATMQSLDNDDASRPIAPARAAGEPDGSRILKGAERSAAVGTTATAAAGGGFVAWLSEQIEALRDLVLPGRALLRPLSNFVVEYWWVLLLAAGVFVLWQQARIRRARIEDHRTGKTA